MNSKSYFGQTLTISAAQVTKNILKVYKKGNMISLQMLGAYWSKNRSFRTFR